MNVGDRCLIPAENSNNETTKQINMGITST